MLWSVRASAFRSVFIMAALLLTGCGHNDTTEPSLKGVVRDESGSVAGATVRVQTTEQSAITDSKGRFMLTGLPLGEPVILTAWAPGYYIAGGESFTPGTEGIVLTLARHTDQDNPDYLWLSAFS